MVTTSQQAAAATPTTREERQAAQLAANKAAAEAFSKASAAGGGGLGTGGYGEARTAPDPKKFTNIDLTSPAGRALYEAYKESGVVIDSNTGNVIYNPADLGAREVEVTRAAQGLPPSSKTTGEPSAQYAYNVAKQSSGQVTQLRSQFEQLQKEKAHSQDVIRMTEANIKALQGELAEAQRIKSDKRADSILFSLRAEERQLAQYKKNVQNIDAAIKETAQAEMAAKKKQVQATIQFAEEAGRITEGPKPINNAFGATATKAMQMEPTTPQRPRAKAITGVKEKLFASPGFMQDAETYERPASFLGETRKPRAKALSGVKEKLFADPNYVEYENIKPGKAAAFQIGRDITISLTENISTQKEKAPQVFAVSLSEGAPPKPRKLTQAEVDQMTPEQYAVYKAEFDAYNRYVKEYNKEQRQKQRESFEAAKKEILEFTAEAKKTGSLITINTTSGVIIATPETAYKKIIENRGELVGLGTVPNIPEGYTLAGNLTGFPSSLILVPQPRNITQDITGKVTDSYGSMVQPYGPQPPPQKDFLTLVGERATQIVQSPKSNELQKTLAAFGQVGIETFGGFVKIEKYGGKAFADFINATTANKTQYNTTTSNLPVTPIALPETVPGVVLGGVTSGVAAAAATKSPGVFLSESQKAFIRAGELVQKQGIGPTIAQIGGYVAPFSPSAAVKLVPLRATTLRIGTAEGPRVVEQVISLGYGTGKTIFGRYGPAGEGKFFIGAPKPQLSGIEKIRGATGGSFNVYELAGYSKRELGLLKPIITYAEEKGLVRPGAFEQKLKEAKAMETFKKLDVPYEKGFAPNELKTISPGIKSEETLGKVAQAQKQGLLEKAKGSLVFTKIEGGLKKPYSDIDVTAKTVERGEKAAELITKAPTEKGFELARSGSNVFIKDLTKGTEKEVINIVTPKEELIDLLAGASKTGKVYGYKQPKDGVKLLTGKGKTMIKSEGAKQQLTSKIKSISGFLTKETLAEATNLTPQQKEEILGPYLFTFGGKAHRYVKENVHTFMGLREGARLAFKAGDRQKALLFGETMAGIIKYGKGINWYKELRQYKPDLEIPTTETVTESGIRGSVKSFTQKLEQKPSAIIAPTLQTPKIVSGFEKESPTIKPRVTSGRPVIISSTRGSIYGQPKEPISPIVLSGRTASPRSVMIPSGRSAFISGGSVGRTTSPRIESGMSSFQKKPKSPSPASVFKREESPRSGLVPSPESPLSPMFGSPGTPSPGITKGPSPSLKPSPTISPIIPIIPKLFPLEFPTPKPVTGFVPKVFSETKIYPDKSPKRTDFLGNASEEEIALGFNRTEIITGEKRTARQLKKDITFGRKLTGRTQKLITQKTGSVLSKKKQSILFRAKPKVVKREKRKTGGFF